MTLHGDDASVTSNAKNRKRSLLSRCRCKDHKEHPTRTIDDEWSRECGWAEVVIAAN